MTRKEFIDSIKDLNIEELTRIIKNNFADKWGYIDIRGLNFDGKAVNISGMKAYIIEQNKHKAYIIEQNKHTAVEINQREHTAVEINQRGHTANEVLEGGHNKWLNLTKKNMNIRWTEKN